MSNVDLTSTAVLGLHNETASLLKMPSLEKPGVQLGSVRLGSAEEPQAYYLVIPGFRLQSILDHPSINISFSAPLYMQLQSNARGPRRRSADRRERR